jgi:hypothetical protein
MIWRRSYLVRQVQVIQGDPPAELLAEYVDGEGGALDDWFCSHGDVTDEFTELVDNDDLDYWGRRG